jgi:aminopeptidase-like protein
MERVDKIDSYLKRLFPINRSITGEGTRKTLNILKEIIPLKILEYSSGQKVYDWTIPKEWNIRDAWIKNSKGEKIIDFKLSNLHVVGYSLPIHKKIKLSELDKNIHYLKNIPDAIPYLTSYYDENWGFCVSYNQYLELFNNDEEYEIYIDSELANGSLALGELLIKGRNKKEYLLSCYICHPSMANDSLSGVIATAFIAKELLKLRGNLEYSYRIVFVPETIGAIVYCANNENEMKSIDKAMVITTCGGPGNYGYKESWDRSSLINVMVEDVFKENEIDYETYSFDIHGSDERQYSSGGFRINCVTITKDKYYEYNYYHTSLDNLDFVTSESIDKTVDLYLKLVSKMDKDIVFSNKYPNCEVMLSKHDLYPKIGGALMGLDLKNPKTHLDITLELLFYCDGKISLFELSKQLNVNLNTLYDIGISLVDKDILEVAG